MTWLDLWTGIWSEVWGVFQEPYQADDTQYYNTTIEVYDDSDPHTLIDIIPTRLNPSCLTELRAHGAGSFRVSKGETRILENPSLIDYRKYYKLRMNGDVVGGFIAQTKKTVIVGEGEESDETWEITGEGPRSWSRDATVYPAKGLKASSSDTRYFNFATEQGSWYNPAQWTNATVTWNWMQAGNWYGTAPVDWPDAPTAKWIWDRALPYAMPQGYVYFRREFNVPTAASHSLFVAADDQAEIYVDGELLHTTTINAWQDTNRVDFDLEAGDHVIGIKAYNYRSDGPGSVIAALFKFGDPLVPTSASLVLVSDTSWKVQGYPSVEPGWTAGDVLLTLLAEAEARGVRFAQNWTPTFTAQLDSSGESWGNPVPWSFAVGSTYEEVISSIEELGCDIWIDPDTLEMHAWKKRGVDRSIEGINNGTPVEQFRNLVTNPSFEGTDGTVEVRRNLLPNTSFEVNTFGWSGAGTGAPTPVRVTTQSLFGAASLEVACSGTSNSQGAYTNARPVVTAGLTYTASTYIKGEAGKQVRLEFGGWDGGGALLGGGRTLGPIVTLSGGWERLSVTMTMPVDTVSADMVVRNVNAVAHTFYLDGALMEKSSIVQPFFDGATQPRLRINRMLNPSPTSVAGSSTWLNAGAASVELVSGERGQNAIRQTRTSNGAAIALYGQRNQPEMPSIVPGETWTLSLTAKASVEGISGISMGVVAANNTAFLHGASEPLNLTTEEERYSFTITIPAVSPNEGQIMSPRIGWLSGAGVTDDWIEISEVQLEQTSESLPFLDGATPDESGFGYDWSGVPNASPSYKYDTDFTPSWTGTAHSSISVLSGDKVTTEPDSFPERARRVQSSHWSKSGTRSIRIIPLLDVSYAEMVPIPVTAGKTYTLLGTIHLDAPQTGTLFSAARGYTLTGTPAVGVNPQYITTAPNQAGDHEVRATIVPVATGTIGVRLWNGASEGNGDVWWDNFMVIEGEYSADYFDGDTPMSGGFTYSWTGPIHASQSIASSYTPLTGNTIILMPGHNLLAADETGQAEIANTLMLHAKDGWKEESYTDTTSLTKYGRVETQISTQLSANGATPLVQELFRTKALPEKSATFDIIPVDGMIPFIDFNVGDVISAPSEVPDVYESRRIMSIAFTEDEATGKPNFAVEFDTIFKDRQSELEKWVSRISNSSAIGGGFANSGMLPPTATVGQPGSSLGSVPDAPTGLVVGSVGHFSEDGSSLSDYSLTWNPVVTGTGFGQVQITEYEVWGRPVTETESGSMAVVFDTFAYLPNFRAGDEWAFKVRAVSRTGGPGPFSSEVSLVAANPIIVLGKPSTPELSSSMGTVTIDWDGLIAGNPAPGYVRFLRVERTSAGSTGTWQEKRRNIALSPYATVLSRFSSSGGANVSLSLITDMTGPTTTAVRSTRLSTINVRLLDILVGTGVGVSTSYRVRFRVRSSHALNDVSVIYRPSVNISSTSVTFDVVDIPAGQSYVDVTGTTHANSPSSTAGWTLIHNGTQVGATLDVTDILIEKMPSDGSMVAGNLTSVDPSKRYRWLGTADSSASVYEENDPWVPVGTLLRGSTIDASGVVGNTYDYRLVAVDTYGGESTPSDPASITVEGVQSGGITGGLASQNLVANGSFEEGFQGWEIVNIYPNGGSAAEIITTGGIAGANYLRLTRGTEIPGSGNTLSVGQEEDVYIPISSVGAQGYFLSAKVAADATYSEAFSLFAFWYQGDKVTPASVESSAAANFVDVSATAQYVVGQVFPPVDARFMRVVLVSGLPNSVLHVDDVVAREVIQAGMIGENSITSVHVSAGSITANALQAGAVTADAIAAGAILADKIGAGEISTNHLSSEVGASLDISSNASVNIIVNRQDTIEGDLADTQSTVEGLQTYYSFGPEGAIIGQTDSAFKLYLKNDRIEILENGVVVSYWDSGQMVVNRFVGHEVVLANHKFETYGTGTVVKKL